MRALVTGGTGFIGSHLVDRFLQLGYEVRILDNLEPRVHPHGVPKYVPRDVEFIQGSVTDRDAWARALEGVDVVSHQAAYQDYMLDFSKFLLANAVSTALLYEVLIEKRLQPRKVIVASSQAVYGEGQYDCPEHGLVLPQPRGAEQLQRGEWEIHCPRCGKAAAPRMLEEPYVNPCNAYAVSKHSGERAGLGLGRLYGFPTVALRYSITQGPRQSLFNQYSGILRIFCARAMSGQPVIVYEDGKQTRDFVHIQDVVDANFKVLEDSRADFQAFNVGSGKRVSVLEFAQTLLAKLKNPVPIQTPSQYRVGDNRHSVSSIEALQQLGWRPQRNLAKIVEDFLAWLDEIGGIPSGILDAYANMQKAGVVKSTQAAAK